MTFHASERDILTVAKAVEQAAQAKTTEKQPKVEEVTAVVQHKRIVRFWARLHFGTTADCDTDGANVQFQFHGQDRAKRIGRLGGGDFDFENWRIGFDGRWKPIN